MSSHHDDHSTEVKEVSFGTPFILALVTVLVILAFVSIGDNNHGCKTEAKHGHEATHEQHGADHSATTPEAGHTEEAHH